jgi:magnesium-transporting ATPase (P-type)
MGLANNRLLWWGILSEVLVIVLIVFVPAAQDVIGTAPFPAVGWVWLLLGVPLLPLADELRKALLRRRERARP